jgi:hypothetical protein
MWKLHVVYENKEDREKDSIDLLLEQALMQQGDEMMENFPTSFNAYR